MSKYTRRQFLEDSMFAAATAVCASSTLPVFAQEEKGSANDELKVCVVGAGGRGGSHIGAWTGKEGRTTKITHICDVDSKRAGGSAESIGKAQGLVPKVIDDVRRVLDDKTVNIISIATPNHQHSI